MSEQCITEQPGLTGHGEQINKNNKKDKNDQNSCCYCCQYSDFNSSDCADCGHCCDNNMAAECMECFGHICCCCSVISNPNCCDSSGADCSNADCSGADCGDVCSC